MSQFFLFRFELLLSFIFSWECLDVRPGKKLICFSSFKKKKASCLCHDETNTSFATPKNCLRMPLTIMKWFYLMHERYSDKVLLQVSNLLKKK
jgi:hypothetical protein